ncbi:MAG TPA: hypothetical protein VGQ17_15930 [Gemmatimonadales bacterium]|jgi:hypothetical protein|nr:hypothetical protein [Gemmatimonadales bacterium]
MTDCKAMSERMPAVARGGAPWGAAEAAHLSGCPACRAEWELVLAAERLGARSAGGVDTARIAAAVRYRLRQAPLTPAAQPFRRVGRWFAGLATAAVVILALRLAVPNPERPVTGPAPAAAAGSLGEESLLTELDRLTSSELEAVLDGFEAPAEALPHVDGAALDQLKPQELERVLRSLGG